MLHEIAEDLLDALERLNSIERQVRDQGRAMEAMWRDLLGNNRAMAAKNVFDAVSPAIDTLATLSRGLNPATDAAAYGQLISAGAVLGIILQTLGYQRFEAVEGDLFDPGRMQCLGYGEGPPSKVLQALRPGYLAGETVVRPAGVLIADPLAATRQEAINPDLVEDQRPAAVAAEED